MRHVFWLGLLAMVCLAACAPVEPQPVMVPEAVVAEPQLERQQLSDEVCEDAPGDGIGGTGCVLKIVTGSPS